MGGRRNKKIRTYSTFDFEDWETRIRMEKRVFSLTFFAPILSRSKQGIEKNYKIEKKKKQMRMEKKKGALDLN